MRTGSPEHKEYIKRLASLTATRVALAYMEYRHAEGLISGSPRLQFKFQLMKQVDVLASTLHEMCESVPSLNMKELAIIQRGALVSALFGLLYDGMISTDEFEELVAEIDSVLATKNIAPIPELTEKQQFSMSSHDPDDTSIHKDLKRNRI
jgi:hypothetical protein